MLDIKRIRQNQELIQTTADLKGIPLSVAELVELDEERRLLLKQVEGYRQERNRLSQQISRLFQEGNLQDAENGKRQVSQLKTEMEQLEKTLREVEKVFTQLMMRVPNIVSPDTPVGRSDEDNVELRRVGEVPAFSFEPRDHVALGELHRLIDLPRGVKTAGSRNYYLNGIGALLHRAVQQLALDMLLSRGFHLLDVPLMVRTESMLGTGYFPTGEDQTYRLTEGDRWLVGTSEVPLVSYYSNEIVDVTEPIKLAAASLCFRNEVGSAGKDVHGLYRVHQFAKVEQVIICEDNIEMAERMLKEITENAEQLLQLLELPYRVMAVCIGDMSQKTYKQYDIETWMPSRQAYGETHSSSLLLDFQARRSNIRFKDAAGRLKYCYTLNNTAVASPRILIPLLENHQREDGSIRIPSALRPYLGGVEEIALPAV
ncbi:serine--tRNA ligase [Cohnella pontilimi]|uniref:Serine--tRNA ligase n=1 Tax=Cohnella pontilimi TaxID=2564100 RepID=A0A4U0FAM7_9BACL|nr:serine--tRNA ligase [Cohnella pontilimi]TJY41795.1 serine--tRNA ligase [Cohnella pontilimi]